MTVKIDHAARRCEIWLEQGGLAGSIPSQEHRETVRRFRAQGYRVCIHPAGGEPLLPGAAARLDMQRQGFF